MIKNDVVKCIFNKLSEFQPREDYRVIAVELILSWRRPFRKEWFSKT